MNLDFVTVIVKCCIPEANETNLEKNSCNDTEKNCDCWDGGVGETAQFFLCFFIVFRLFVVKLLQRGDNFESHTI